VITRVVKTDSYEIDCATERRLPIKVYLELELQPAMRLAKTITVPNNIKINKAKELARKKEYEGRRAQKVKETNKLRCGADE
jgi:hypothetical protein